MIVVKLEETGEVLGRVDTRAELIALMAATKHLGLRIVDFEDDQPSGNAA